LAAGWKQDNPVRRDGISIVRAEAHRAMRLGPIGASDPSLRAGPRRGGRRRARGRRR
jgi:hypothetical protein